MITSETTVPAGLSFLWLEITGKCNLECVHCYANSGPWRNLLGHMGSKEWFKVITDSARLGCQQLQFIGGEPTLHPDLPQMIRVASQHGYSFIEVFTNATHIGESLLRTFLDHRVNMATSFYSDDSETHDAITGHRGSFNRTVQTLRRVQAEGLPVRVGIIETRANAGHGERAIQFLNNLGITNIKVDVQRGVGRGADVAVRSHPMSQLCGECWKGKLCVTSTGTAYPCVFSRFADLGNAKAGIDAIVASTALATFRSELRRYEEESGILRIDNSVAELDSQIKAGCNPNCAPCGPEVYPIQECTPKRADVPGPNSSNIGKITLGRFRTVASACTPSSPPGPCSPSTCAPCSPDLFRKAPCAP